MITVSQLAKADLRLLPLDEQIRAVIIKRMLICFKHFVTVCANSDYCSDDRDISSGDPSASRWNGFRDRVGSAWIGETRLAY